MARQLLADWDNAEEAMRQRFTLQMGKVAIAAMPSFAGNPLPPILKAFRDRYAGINVAVHDVINEQVFEMIREGRVEMGIAFEPEPSDTLHPAVPRSLSGGGAEGFGAGAQGAGKLEGAADAGFHHPAAAIGGAATAGAGAGPQRTNAGGGV